MSFTETFLGNLDNPDKDIVVVHGLSRGGHKPWVETQEDPAWLSEDLFQNCDVRVIGFGYNTSVGVEGFVYDRRGLETVARQLLDSIQSWRGEYETNRPLAFLSHDFGGTVVKMALVIASQDGDTYGSIFTSTYALVFGEFAATFHLAGEVRIGLDSPHNTLLCGDDRKKAYKSLRNILRFSADGTKLLSPITERFSALDLLLSATSPAFIPQIGFHDSTTNDLISKDDVVQWIQHPNSSHAARCLSIPQNYCVSDVMMGLIQAVSDNVELDDRREIKHFVFRFSKLRLHPDVDVPKSFDGLSVALSSFVAQSIAYLLPRISAENRLCYPFSNFKVASSSLLSKADLMKSFVVLNMWLWENGFHAAWSLWNMECCEGDGGPARLAQAFTDCFRFTEFKPAFLFAFSEESGSDVFETMQSINVPTINLRVRDTSVSNIADLCTPRVTTLAALYAMLDDLPENIRKVLVNSNVDISLRRVYFRWIVRTARTSLTKTQWMTQIDKAIDEKGELEPKRLQAAILNSLQIETREVFRKALRWILYSCRPLSPPELIEALGSEYLRKPFASTDDTKEAPSGTVDGLTAHLSFDAIEDSLSGLVTVTDNEVRLAPGLDIDVLKAFTPNVGNLWRVDEAESHLEILGCTLSHLSTQLQRHVSHDQPMRPLYLSPFRGNFTAYAVYFWSQHYKLAQRHVSTKDRVEMLLAYFMASEPSTASVMLKVLQTSRAENLVCNDTNTGIVAVVALLARCGITDPYEISRMAGYSCWEKKPGFLFPAMLQAVRQGNGELVKKLSLSSLDNDDTATILMAVKEGELKLDAMNHLFNDTNARKGFRYPAEFIAHGIDMGMEGITEVIQHCGDAGRVQTVSCYRRPVRELFALEKRYLDEFPNLDYWTKMSSA